EPIRFVAYLTAADTPEGQAGPAGQAGREGLPTEARSAEVGQDGRATRSKKHDPGTDLVIHDLGGAADQKIVEVAEYAVAKDGSAIAYSVSSKTPASEGAFVRKIADGSTKTLTTGAGDYKGFVF